MSKVTIKTDNPIDKDLMWFGIRADTGRPILERPKKNRCKNCSGFGTYGNPLCGVVYTCKPCNGTGLNLKFTRRSFFHNIISFLKG